MFGTNTPNDWLIELCSNLIQSKNLNDSACYKSFVVELEVKNLIRAKKYDGSATSIALKEKREKQWLAQNKDKKINPSKRSDKN
jgi:hypothetical protein